MTFLPFEDRKLPKTVISVRNPDEFCLDPHPSSHPMAGNCPVIRKSMICSECGGRGSLLGEDGFYDEECLNCLGSGIEYPPINLLGVDRLKL